MASQTDIIFPTELVCQSDFPVVGFVEGERATSVVRTVCTLITVSIISSWCSRRNIGRLLLFFSHWLSGLVHQISELIMAEMVLLCWSKTELLILIKSLKFLEVVGGNMLAVTNVAICVNLALIVSSHRTMSRVKSNSSPLLMLSLLAISVAATVAVVPFWDTVAMSGTLFWPSSADTGSSEDWVWISVFFLELIAGVLMTAIVALLVIFRLPELKQVLSVHRRIKFYFGLTMIAIFVDLAIGVGGVLYLVGGKDPMYIAVTWTMRHIHIALDTLVLYSALGEARFDMETTQPSVGSSNEQGNGIANGHHHIPKRLAAAATSSRRREGGGSIQHSYATGTV